MFSKAFGLCVQLYEMFSKKLESIHWTLFKKLNKILCAWIPLKNWTNFNKTNIFIKHFTESTRVAVVHPIFRFENLQHKDIFCFVWH